MGSHIVYKIILALKTSMIFFNVYIINLCFVFRLMMAQRDETCRRNFKVYWLIKLTYIIAKHNGMALIKDDFQDYFLETGIP